MNHPPIKHNKTGILLVNLGTPDGTDYFSIRRYLKEFLSDRRVIEVPRIIWFFVLNFIILSFRPLKVAKNYKSIWRNSTNESPLRYYTRELANKIKPKNGEVVEWAMCYGNPSIKSKIQALRDAGCDNLKVIALYPQYSATTTAAVYDRVFDALKTLRWQPGLQTIQGYHDNPVYIKALANSVKKHLKTLSYTPDKIICSFHGIPQSYFDKGDPYQCYCHKTTRLLREELGYNEEQMSITFQSRFGPKAWLQPYTDVTVEQLAKDGVESIAIITPGFAADCLETIDEIGEEVKEIFLQNGGKNFSFIPCLNNSADGVKVVQAIV